ncbi:MAG: 4Fe-4S double cluster binding domain-containing protein [Flavonifractor plautii]
MPERPAAPDCPGCGACRAACPAGALGEGGPDVSRCLSELTQKKGALTEEEAARLRVHPLIWGCDFCQRACPYNAAPARSPLPEFSTSLVDALENSDLEGSPTARSGTSTGPGLRLAGPRPPAAQSRAERGIKPPFPSKLAVKFGRKAVCHASTRSYEPQRGLHHPRRVGLPGGSAPVPAQRGLPARLR